MQKKLKGKLNFITARGEKLDKMEASVKTQLEEIEKGREDFKTTEAECVEFERLLKEAESEGGANLVVSGKPLFITAEGRALAEGLSDLDPEAVELKRLLKAVEVQQAKVTQNIESHAQNVISKPAADDDEEMEFDAIELGLLRPEELDCEAGEFVQFPTESVPPTSQYPEVWKAFIQKQNVVAQTNAAVFKQVCGIRVSLKEVLSRVWNSAGKDGRLLVKKPKLFAKA